MQEPFEYILSPGTGNFIGSFGIMEILLKNGIDVNAVDDGGNTALMLAVKNSEIVEIQKLLEFECNLELVNNKGETALEIAKRKAAESKVVGNQACVRFRHIESDDIVELLQKYEKNQTASWCTIS